MAEDEQPVETKKKKKGFLWLIVGGGVLAVLAVGGYLAVDYFRPPEAAASTEPETRPTPVKSTMNLDAFLVNLADEEAPRFIKITLRLGLSEANLGEMLAGDPVVVAAARDKIISILTTKTSQQILSPEGKNALRNEVRDVLNTLMPRGKVVEVYIMDFVVQM